MIVRILRELFPVYRLLPCIWGAVIAAGASLVGSYMQKRGQPKAPAGIPYKKDPFVGSDQFTSQLKKGDKVYFNKLMDYVGKQPGYDEETIQAMYNTPAEQSKFAEKSALARLNQGASMRGASQSGGRLAGRGRILTGFGAGRAQMQRMTRVDAAKVALSDRINQLKAMGNYTDTRMQASLQETAIQNRYQGGLNNLAYQNYATELGQHNQNWQQYTGFINDFGSAMMEGKTGKPKLPDKFQGETSYDDKWA